MNAEGLVLIALGLGLFWSAGANAREVSVFARIKRAEARRRGYPRWFTVIWFPRTAREARVVKSANLALAGLVTASGVLLLLGGWRV